ncbi:MAG: repressor LexA [Nitrospirae bacterium]|nr:repressor LexA [Nitrospirota bacterium]
MKDLTHRQQKVLAFLKKYAAQYGYPPTVREIGSEFSILWPAARGHLQALAKKGAIRLNPAVSRGIELLSSKSAEGISVPVAGSIRAGSPMLAVQDVESYIFLDKNLFRSEELFSLKVTGDSMKDAGIFDGDYVIVKPQKTIKSGEIGIALVNDEATVKRIIIKGNKILLKPENSSMETVVCPAADVSIIGRVTGVVRKL